MKKNILNVFILALATVFIVGFYIANKALNQPILNSAAVTDSGYIMPRLQKMISYFSLADRQVSYNFENPFSEKSVEAQNSTKLVAHEAKPKAVVTKNNKTDVQKKEAEEKKKKAAAEAEKRKKTIAAQRQDFQRRKEVYEQYQKYQEQQRQARLNNTSKEKPSIQPAAHYYAGGNPQLANSAALDQAVAQSAEDKEKEEKRLAQVKEAKFWQDTLQSRPTADNALALVKALEEGKITSDQYYKIIEGLIASRSTEHEKVGLYLIYNQASSKAFQIVAQNINTMTDANKATAKGYLDSYNESSKLPFVNAALGSSDAKVKVIALTILKDGVSKIKQGANPYQTDGRHDRAVAASGPLTVERYSSFIASLKRLVAEGSQDYSSLAQEVLSQLETVVASAQ